MTAVLMVIGGLAMLFVGGEALIKGAVSLARNFGLSRLLVSAVVVGFGTSAPGLTASIGAALQGASDSALGNVVGSNILGSNIFNILSILGLTAILSPIGIANQIATLNVWIMLASAALLSAYLLRGWTINRFSGFVMIGAYVGYTTWLYSAG